MCAWRMHQRNASATRMSAESEECRRPTALPAEAGRGTDRGLRTGRGCAALFAAARTRLPTQTGALGGRAARRLPDAADATRRSDPACRETAQTPRGPRLGHERRRLPPGRRTETLGGSQTNRRRHSATSNFEGSTGCCSE
ncbi:hypothetical protein TGMAS_417050 [Toxoplasma gondii MAS]|uniref:Uncharacterized protein n=1 Tax=Toxoplasma gondii MAS TaxID=943118 RepID=A0A086PNA0_TOXGO|nr:hypothetical protein TGMAS_417050 [Toxoplasma gondii MAS]